MADERGGATTLKGRLADVYVPALVDGALSALSRRLGNRATVDDPRFGRASTLSSIDPLLTKFAAYLNERQAKYRHVASVTGIDRDVSEGRLVFGSSGEKGEIPIAVVAERRRLREIELRIYCASESEPRRPRGPLTEARGEVATPQIIAHVIEALRKGAVERVLAAFEESSRFIDPLGNAHPKRDGAMAAFLGGSRIDLVPAGVADDGRTCVIEAAMIHQHSLGGDAEAATLSFERGDSGLLRELRFYYEP